MAKKKKYYKRDYLRQHYATKTFISNDGLHVERDYFDSETKQMKTYNPPIFEDFCNRRFIELKNYGKILIAELVITCYCAPKPDDGKKYEIEHIDGDLSNDHRSNLRWVEATPAFLAQQNTIMNNNLKSNRMANYKSLKIKVQKDGTITQNKEVLRPYYHFYDSDLDWDYHWGTAKIDYTVKNAYNRYERRSIAADKVMEDFGFVSGNKAQFQNPVVLHTNNDFTDFTPGNLEWCESTDPRYVAYRKITHDRCMEEDRRTNRKFLSPGSWKVVYPNEPYQQWSEWMTDDEKAHWTDERIQADMERVWPTDSLNNDEKQKENETQC